MSFAFLHIKGAVGRRQWVQLLIGLIAAGALIYAIQNVGKNDSSAVTQSHSLDQLNAAPRNQEFSFFLLASVLQMEHPNLDSFDLFYRSLPAGSSASDQLKVVNEKAPEITKLEGYRRDFSLALIHVARVLLEPKQAVEERGTQWANGFDMDSFRTQFESASNSLHACGSIGEGILKQLNRVSQEIDEDQNEEFSNEEIEKFLSPKLRRFKRSTN